MMISPFLADLLGLPAPQVGVEVPMSLPGDSPPSSPAPRLCEMLAELQAAHPERAPGEPGWEQSRLAWPDGWFDSRDPGQIAPCRALWASALLACIRDTVKDMSRFEAKVVGKGRAQLGWIGSRDFHEMCALAGLDGHAVVDRLRHIDDDPELRSRILREGVHKSSSVLAGGDDD